MPTTDQPLDYSRYRVLVERIAARDELAEKELYELLSPGLRFFLARSLPRTEDMEDELHNVFLIVVHAIQHGHIREPERLLGYVRGVVKHRLVAKIEEIQRMRLHVEASDFNLGGTPADVEEEIADKERKQIAMKVLQGMSAKHREVLVRFYLNEQTPDEIRREMCLTETQFRLLKSRAKACFVEQVNRKHPRGFTVGRVVAFARRAAVA